MMPTPIPKKGAVRHFYCEVCHDDMVHLIREHSVDYVHNTIYFWALCLNCWGKHNAKLKAKEAYPTLDINVPEMLIELTEMDFKTWNEFIKFASYD